MFLSPLVLLAGAGLVASGPVSLTSRDVSSSVLDDLTLAGQYAAAAYCAPNNDSPGASVSCEAGNCPLVEAASTETLIEFENSEITDVTGFVAVDSTNRQVVVSFRGSVSVRNWLTNVDITLEASDLCDGCMVHQGFWRSWEEARPDILTAVEEASADNADFDIVATGHSLGGALATLCAADLRNRGFQVALYSYGAPQIGDQTTADFITAQGGGNFRVTHLNDVVPKLPGELVDYRHFGPEFFITSDTGEAVTAADVTMLQGQSADQGNLATAGSSIRAHSWYLGPIGACSPTEFEF